MGLRSDMRVYALRVDRRLRALIAPRPSFRPPEPANVEPVAPPVAAEITPTDVDADAHSHAIDFATLQAAGRFHRDSRVGGMFHAGQVSLREDAPKDSLHISLRDGNRVSVHMDRFSPLAERRAGRRRGYSVVRVIVHNAGIVWDYLVLFVTRRFGEQRCELECEQVCSDEHEVDEGETTELPAAGEAAALPEAPLPADPGAN